MKVKGTSQVSNAPVLNQKFWQPGRTVAGIITRHVNTKNGPIMEMRLDKPITKKGDKKAGTADETIASVILGNQRGLQMCAESANIAWPYPVGAHVTVRCTGTQHTRNGDMTLFEVDFDLPDDVREDDLDRNSAYDWSGYEVEGK